MATRTTGDRHTAPRFVGRLIVATACVRLVLAAVTGLGTDESYAVAVARPASLGYFDHPPVHFWIAGAAQALAGSPAAGPWSGVAVRAPFILLFALTTWLTYLVGARLFDERAGAWSAAILNVSAVFSLSTGSWVLPDGPLMCASMATVYCVVRALDGTGAGWWLGAGVAGGLALLSKYHAIFLAAGIFLALVTVPAHRRWLRSPAPYLAVAIGVLLFSPVLLWNAHHGWVSFRFQAGRGVPRPGLHLDALARNIGGQIAYVLPWIWVPLVAALFAALRRGPGEPRGWLLACLASWPIAVFTGVALGGNPGLPHWPALGYLMAIPLLGRWAAAREPTRWWRWSAGALAAVTAVGAVQAATGWLPLPPRADPTLDLVDWRALRSAIDSGNLLPPGRVVAATSWIQAGRVGYALGPAVPVLCLSAAPHQFLYQRDPAAAIGHDVLLVIRAPATTEGPPPIDRYRASFASIAPLGPVVIRRLAGRPAFRLWLFLAHDLQQTVATSQPP